MVLISGKKWRLGWFFAYSLIFGAARVDAAPVIDDVREVGGSLAEAGEMISVKGAGFGEKPTGSAVLYDHADVAWTNGTLNDHHKSFGDMELIRRIDSDPQTLWAKPSVPDERNTGVLLSRSRDDRFGSNGAHYYASGNNNFLGWPTAHGGTKVNSDSNKMYAAFWMKIPYDLANYYAVPGNIDSSAFLDGGAEAYGEEIRVEGQPGVGRIISYKPDLGTLNHGWIFFEPPPGIGRDDMIGRAIVGESSGAKVVFPDSASLSKFDDAGYLMPSGKYARIWTDDSGLGYGFAMGNVGWPGTGDSIWANSFGGVSATPGEWNFFEIALDVGDPILELKPSLRVSINGKTFVEGTDEWAESVLLEAKAKGLSDEPAPTLALVGINDFMTVPFSFDLDDIYLDDTFQRIKVCSAASIEEVRSGAGACELQHILKWESSSIEFRLYVGSLAKFGSDLYLYVYDGNGVPNREGYPIKSLFGSAPKPPSLISID